MKSSRSTKLDAKLTSRRDRTQNSHAAAGLLCSYYLLMIIIKRLIVTMTMTITMIVIMIMIMITIMITVTRNDYTE